MPGALRQTVLPYLGVTANARAWSRIGCVRPVSPAVERKIAALLRNAITAGSNPTAWHQFAERLKAAERTSG